MSWIQKIFGNNKDSLTEIRAHVDNLNSQGSIYVSTPIETSITTVSVATKILGETSIIQNTDFTSVTDNKLVYTGLFTRNYNISVNISLVSAVANKLISFSIYKNGVLIEGSTNSIKQLLSPDASTISIGAIVELSQNDYIEIYGANQTDNTNFTVTAMTVNIK